MNAAWVEKKILNLPRAAFGATVASTDGRTRPLLLSSPLGDDDNSSDPRVFKRIAFAFAFDFAFDFCCDSYEVKVAHKSKAKAKS